MRYRFARVITRRTHLPKRMFLSNSSWASGRLVRKDSSFSSGLASAAIERKDKLCELILSLYGLLMVQGEEWSVGR